MGSKRKKKEKTKDFTKQKLKVGKTKPKASNATDTSFTVKSINVPLQSVMKHKTSEEELLRNISLTKHNTPQVRKEAVLFIQKHLRDHPTLMKSLLNSIAKLIIDSSTQVRTEAYNTLKMCSPVSVQLNYNMIILYIQSAMTHINVAIRNDSTKFLEALTQLDCLEYLVNNNWIKLMKCFFSLLNWPLDANKQNVSLSVNIGSSSEMSNSSKSSGKNVKLRHLQVLNNFISYGALGKTASENDNSEGKDGEEEEDIDGLHPMSSKYLNPDIPSPFNHLQLFSRSLNHDLNDLNNLRCEDILIRRKVLCEIFADSMVREVNNIIKEGGELGRVGKGLLNTINQFIENEDLYKKSIGVN